MGSYKENVRKAISSKTVKNMKLHSYFKLFWKNVIKENMVIKWSMQGKMRKYEKAIH